MTRLWIGVVFGVGLLGVALALLSRGVGRVGSRGFEVRETLHPSREWALAGVPVFGHEVSRVLTTKRELFDSSSLRHV